MLSRGFFLRARLPICALAAITLHGVAARALPGGHHRHATAAVPVADEPAPKVEIEQEQAQAEESPPSAPAVKDEAHPSSPAPAPARAAPPPAAKTKIESAPEDSSSDSTAPSTVGEGDSDGDGASGDGTGARGGAGTGGGHDGTPDAPPGPPAKVRKPTGPAKLDVERDWSKCPFPEQTKRDHAFVRISVTVGPNGDAVDVKVLADPGDGFGAAASACAKRHRYVAGKNEDGVAEQTETEPFLVFFTR